MDTAEVEVREAISQAVFKDAMAETCSPVTIVTTLHGGTPHGTTVSAFASLSLDPPMIMAALDRRSELLPKVQATGYFGVSVLRSDQSALAGRFASKGDHRFRGISWTLDRGLPRIPGSAVWLGCRVDNIVAGGDHVIVLGAVERGTIRQAPPLTYHRRGFGTHAPHHYLPAATAS